MEKPTYQELEDRIARLEQAVPAGCATPEWRDLGAGHHPLYEAMAEYLLLLSQEGTLLFANQGAMRFITCGRDAVASGQALTAYLPAAQADEVLNLCAAALGSGETVKQQILLNPGSGSRWFDCSVVPLIQHDVDGPAVMLLLLDSTAFMMQQTYLQQSEEQYRILFDAMQEGVIYFASTTEVLAMNAAAQRILGYSLKEYRERFANEHVWQICHDDGRKCTREDNPVAYCFKTGQKSSGLILKTLQPKTNSEIWVVVNVTPLPNRNGATPKQVIATFNEITDRIALRRSKQARLSLLENAPRWSMQELLQRTIDAVCELTASPAGFYHFVEEEQGVLARRVWSSRAKEKYCQIESREGSTLCLEGGGVWTDCLRERKPVIHNDYASLPHKKGLPKGHVPIVREMVVPVLRGTAIVAILGVGNKAGDYTQEEAALVQDFAELAWDLVEQKRVEKERVESRRKLNALISNLPGMAFSVENNPERTLHFVSDGGLDLTGYTPNELLGPDHSSLAALIHPEDRERVVSLARHAASCGRPYEAEYRLLHANGTERIVLERATGVTSRFLDKTVLEGFVTDITERKNAALQIMQSHQQLLTILDSIEAHIFVADMETHEVLFVNRKMKEAFGSTLTGNVCYTSFQRQDTPCPFCTSHQLLDGHGEPGPVIQWENLNPVTGRWYVNYDRAVRWFDGKLVQMQVAFDNTERKEAEIKLRQVQKIEAIGLLAGGVAHDFNNILSVILGYTTMALAELKDSSSLRVKRDLLQIQKAGLRARDLVKQILSFCQHSEEHFQPLNLQLIIKEVVKMLRSSFPSTIGINAKFSGGDRMVLADPSQVHQVLMNLCTNAMHAMKNGGELAVTLQHVDLPDEHRRPELSGLPAGSYLRLSVSDTGSGIPAELLDKIFDPFFTTKVEGEGTGLGLAVVQGIATSHKGAVTVDSILGQGSEFALFLPEYAGQEEMETAVEEDHLPGGTETVLIIDDEPAVADILQRLLERLGYFVEAFTDSAEAFKAYTRKYTEYDLVITDMTMPNFTGMALARAMLALRPDQPIIICTGYSDSVDEAGAREEGVRELLSKPIALETLAQAVRRALTPLSSSSSPDSASSPSK